MWSMTKKRSSEIFAAKMEIFHQKSVIQKSWVRRKYFPSPQTRRQVSATVRRDGFNASDPVNFDPITSVSFFLKLIGKMVAVKLTALVETNNLLPIFQPDFLKATF